MNKRRYDQKEGNGPVLRGKGFTWSYGKGYTHRLEYEGLYDDLIKKLPGLTQVADEMSLDQIGDSTIWKLSASQGGDEEPVHEYQLRRATLQQSVFLNPRVHAGLGNNTENITLVNALWEKIRSARSASANDSAWLDAAVDLQEKIEDPDQYAFAFTLLEELNKDVTSFLKSNVTFVHTVTYSRTDETAAPNFNNIDRIHTTQQMADDEGYPYINQLPANKEWLKQHPDVAHTLGQRKTITTEYLAADSWSRTQYALYGAP